MSETGARQALERESDSRDRLERFTDGCHRYGWMISVVSSIATMIITIGMVFYFMGGMNAKVESMLDDIKIMKNEIFDLSHGTRGPDDRLKNIDKYDEWKKGLGRIPDGH